LFILLAPCPVGGLWGFGLGSCTASFVTFMLNPLDRTNIWIGEDVEDAIAKVERS
jgi:hypothetical protein